MREIAARVQWRRISARVYLDESLRTGRMGERANVSSGYIDAFKRCCAQLLRRINGAAKCSEREWEGVVCGRKGIGRDMMCHLHRALIQGKAENQSRGRQVGKGAGRQREVRLARYQILLHLAHGQWDIF